MTLCRSEKHLWRTNKIATLVSIVQKCRSNKDRKCFVTLSVMSKQVLQHASRTFGITDQLNNIKVYK
jgi:hypothetical protein